MQTHTFYSTDTGAGSLTGQVGSGIAVLDQVLVNGYNEHTSGVSITRSGTTATVSKTSHGYRDGQIVNIRDAVESDYNGNFRITYVDANTFTYTVANSPSTPATGTIKTKVAPLGWTKPYSGTNVAVYRAPAGTNQMYWRVDDTNGQELRIRGYETMSDANTGTGPFPTVAQIANSCYLYKSSVSTSTARDWFVFSDGRIVYFLSLYSGSSSTGCCGFIFGEPRSNKSGDAYHAVTMGSTGTSSSALQSPTGFAPNTAQSGHYVCRPQTQVGSSAAVYKTLDLGLAYTSSSASSFGSYGLAYPHGPDGGMYLSSIRLMESTSVYRALMPGIWNPCHSRPLAHLDEYTGQGAFSGKKFKAINVDGSGQMMFEISDTWY